MFGEFSSNASRLPEYTKRRVRLCNRWRLFSNSGSRCDAIYVKFEVCLKSQRRVISLTCLSFFSPDGRSYTFDERDSGYERGEGVGCVVIKALAAALRDGDSIRTLIRGSGVNSDGRTPGVTLPSSIAQEDLIRAIYAKAELDPRETVYVEAHGTGTAAGDPVEARALANVLCKTRSEDEPLFIGSIKTNTGAFQRRASYLSLSQYYVESNFCFVHISGNKNCARGVIYRLC
jgi:acyl transferase domain-containing protein